jgi:hypothetical protein
LSLFGTTGVDGSQGDRYARLRLSYNIVKDWYGSGPINNTLDTGLKMSEVETANNNIKFWTGYAPLDPFIVRSNDVDEPIVQGTDEQNVLGNLMPIVPEVVRPGDIVGIRLTRVTINTSGYTGDIGILGIRWNLIPVRP